MWLDLLNADERILLQPMSLEIPKKTSHERASPSCVIAFRHAIGRNTVWPAVGRPRVLLSHIPLRSEFSDQRRGAFSPQLLGSGARFLTAYHQSYRPKPRRTAPFWATGSPAGENHLRCRTVWCATQSRASVSRPCFPCFQGIYREICNFERLILPEGAWKPAELGDP